MAIKPLTTLDEDGIIRSPAKIADRLLAYFYVSDYSQSKAAYGQIASLPYLIQLYTGKIEGLAVAIENELKKLFECYFDSVKCNVILIFPEIEPSSGDTSAMNIQVEMTVDTGEGPYNLAKLLSLVNNSLAKVSELEV